MSSRFAKVLSLSEFCGLRKRPDEVVLTSGAFDPLHAGHTTLIVDSKPLGEALVVVVNGDGFLRAKKGRAFMPLEQRLRVVSAIRGVDYVIPFDPPNATDLTVNEALVAIRPKVFTKGGDRRESHQIPEYEICRKYGIQITFLVNEFADIHGSDLLLRWERGEGLGHT